MPTFVRKENGDACTSNSNCGRIRPNGVVRDSTVEGKSSARWIQPTENRFPLQHRQGL
jgi:hypothetical protein